MSPLLVLYLSRLNNEKYEDVCKRLLDGGIYVPKATTIDTEKFDLYLKCVSVDMMNKEINKKTKIAALVIKQLGQIKYAHDRGLNVVLYNTRSCRPTPDGCFSIRVTGGKCLGTNRIDAKKGYRNKVKSK